MTGKPVSREDFAMGADSAERSLSWSEMDRPCIGMAQEKPGLHDQPAG
jgi:hypothetical protein